MSWVRVWRPRYSAVAAYLGLVVVPMRWLFALSKVELVLFIVSVAIGGVCGFWRSLVSLFLGWLPGR